MTRDTQKDVSEALERGDHETVLRATEAILAARPGDDAAHELRARSFLALGMLEEAERHAADAVRLDPDEIRYRELLANILSLRGAHRDAAAEFGRLARNDPRQPDWTVAEARERIGAAQASMGVEAARRAVRLDPSNGRAQLALAQALARAVDRLPGHAEAREALADALWLADRDGQAFDEFRALAGEVSGTDRDRVLGKARALYRQRAGYIGKAVAAIRPLFDLAFDRGWLRVTE